MSVTRSAPANDPNMSRSAQRKLRLLEIEREQRLEDLEALKMTEVRPRVRVVKIRFELNMPLAIYRSNARFSCARSCLSK